MKTSGPNSVTRSSAADSRKNLLIVTSTFPRWKNDTDPPFVFELAKRLTRDFNITVLAPNYPGALTDEFMAGVSVRRFRYFLQNFEKLAGSEGILPTLKKNKLFYLLVPFFVLAELIGLLKLIRKTRPHIIHAHWILPQGFITALVYKITGVPYIVTTHGGDIYGLQGRFASRLKGYALKNAAAVTVVSKDIQDTINNTFGGNIHTEIIPMGVDGSVFRPDKKNSKIRDNLGIAGPFLLYVGRLSEKKGVRYLLEAMPGVARRHPDVKLLVIGGGEEEENLKQFCRKLGMTEHVNFTGPLSNSELPAYFATADIFIGPSIRAAGGDTEGFGLTFVEAAMSGCVVIGTEAGGIGDIIDHGKTGFLVPEKDPVAIVTVIMRILNAEYHVEEIKQHARQEMIRRFEWQAIANSYARLLNNNTL